MKAQDQREELRNASVFIVDGIEFICKDTLLEWVKLTYGKVSMNPFDCSDAFDELFKKIESL